MSLHRKIDLRTVVGAAWLLMLPIPAFALVSLPSFFSDNMVLQRDTTAPVWGTAAPNEAVTLELNGQTINATADANGNWSAAFKGLAAGGPFTLNIKGAANSIALRNVLVGDVWFCSGQSNMTLHMVEIKDVAQADINAANDPLLHCFTVPQTTADTPASDVKGKWDAGATPITVPGYSAVAYYFAKALRAQLNIPIGIIHCSYPGSSAEAWVPKGVFDAIGLAAKEAAIAQTWQGLDAAAEKYLADLNAWETANGRQDPGNKGFAQGWADPKTDVSRWTPLADPSDFSPLGLANGGVVWIRESVDLPAQLAGKDLPLRLGNLNNRGKEFGNIVGTVYFNGEEIGPIGRTLKHVFSGPDSLTVTAPGRLVSAGPNVIAIRVFTQEEKLPHGGSLGGGTGLLFPLVKPDAMKTAWVAKVEAELPPAPAGAAATRPVPPPAPSLMEQPSVLYNGMLHPFLGYGIKGVAWYQGEGNAGRGEAYRHLFPALIADWRAEWKQGDFPFYFVQIANCFAPAASPGNSVDAELRESQLLTWKAVPGTGMAVTIDLGEANNIHYHKKKPVGERLARVALALTYGQKGEYSGPVYDSMTVEGAAIRLKFTHLGGGLVAQGGPLKQFAIAGADHKFVWADATIDGDSVVVSSKDVAAPAAVRYAWADNPAGCNLYNQAALPASPFRTDDWPLSTLGK